MELSNFDAQAESSSSRQPPWKVLRRQSAEDSFSESGYNLTPVSSFANLSQNSTTPIFPKINYSSGNNIHAPFEPFAEQRKSQDVLHLVDDAASSICIDDDEDIETRFHHAVKTVKSSQTNSNNERDDFAAYNQRVARDYIVKMKEQKLSRKRPRAVDVRDSRQYGNYFTIGSQAELLAYTPSHQLDNFDGKRQLTGYNHWFNQLNSPYTYEEQVRRRQHRREGLGRISEAGGEDGPPADDNESLFTLDVDDLELESELSWGDRQDGNHPYKLKRGLMFRHIQMMSLCGTLGVGVFLNAGQSFFVAGPLGTLLGYAITGLMVLCAMSCFGEMMSLLPSDGGISELVSRLVDDSFGFALGLCYWFSCAMALPSEITAASMLLTYYPQFSLPDHSLAVWVIFFLVLILIISLMEARIWGELQYIFSLTTLVIIVVGLIFFLSLNNGDVGPLYDKVGFRYWDSAKSNLTINHIYGPFRPVYVLSLNGGEHKNVEVTDSIGGNLGRFLQLWAAICSSTFSYVGTEVVFMTSGEVRNPRKTLPAATKIIFFRILIFYVFAIFVVGINLYAGDVRLIGITPQGVRAGSGGVYDTGLGGCVTGHASWGVPGYNSNSSPWVIALQSASLCTVSSVVNSFAVFFALASASSHMYAGSRTLYGLAIQHKLWGVFARCSNVGVPYVAVLFTSIFSLLAFLSISNASVEVFEWLVNLCASSVLLVWAAVSLAFIRFYKSLKLRSDIRSRSDVLYPYKSPLQPFTAYFGLVSSSVVVFLIGLPLFLRDNWDTRTFFSMYVSLIAFVLFYVVHKLIMKTAIVPLDKVDLDTGRKDVENMEWEEDRVYRPDLKGLLWDIYTRFKHLRLMRAL